MGSHLKVPESCWQRLWIFSLYLLNTRTFPGRKDSSWGNTNTHGERKLIGNYTFFLCTRVKSIAGGEKIKLRLKGLGKENDTQARTKIQTRKGKTQKTHQQSLAFLQHLQRKQITRNKQKKRKKCLRRRRVEFLLANCLKGKLSVGRERERKKKSGYLQRGTSLSNNPKHEGAGSILLVGLWKLWRGW